MTITLSRLYDDYATAHKVMKDLEAAGLLASEISIVASNADNWYATTKHDRDRDGIDDRAEGAATGATIGAATGGLAGLLAGFGLLAIPGIGPVVAAGWLASTAAVAAAGGLAGGLIGALTEAGVSEEDAHIYAEGVRRGGTLLTVRVSEEQRPRSRRSSIGPLSTFGTAAWNIGSPGGSPLTLRPLATPRTKCRRSANAIERMQHKEKPHKALARDLSTRSGIQMKIAAPPPLGLGVAPIKKTSAVRGNGRGPSSDVGIGCVSYWMASEVPDIFQVGHP